MMYVPLALFGMGITGFVGNLAGGRLGDWKLFPSMIGILVGWICLSALLAVVATNTWLALIVLGVMWCVGFSFVRLPSTLVLPAPLPSADQRSPQGGATDRYRGST